MRSLTKWIQHVTAFRRHHRDAVVHVVDHGGEDSAGAFGFAGLFLHLLEQPHGLDGDHGLIGEGSRSAQAGAR